MKKFLLDIERYKAEHTVFPPEYDFPGPYYYHGTSSARCAAIQRNGLRAAMSGISKADCEVVAALFARLNWSGNTLGGAPSLRSFSLAHDFVHPLGDPLFLSDMPTNALYFASREWAGGEKTSAIRKAIGELERLITDPRFRDQEKDDPNGRLDPTKPVRASPHDIADLKRALADLAELRKRCFLPYERYRHGVVYAVHLDHTFLRKHTEKTSIGLRVFATVPVQALIARVYLPPAFWGTKRA